MLHKTIGATQDFTIYNSCNNFKPMYLTITIRETFYSDFKILHNLHEGTNFIQSYNINLLSHKHM